MEDRSVSVSEMKRFLACRLRWEWSSAPPRGRGLRPKVGVPALSFGRTIHEVLQIWYDQKGDLEEIYRDYVEDQELPVSELFVEERERLNEMRELGAGMMVGYQSWAETADAHLDFLATETRWDSVPIPGTDQTASGVFDALVKRSDGLWILDFKTTSSTSTDWTSQDLQATIYTYAAQQLYGLPIEGVIFRFLLKRTPYDYHKLILKSGRVTKAQRSLANTTYAKYLEALAVATVKDMVLSGDLPYRESDSLDDYREVLSDVQGTEEFKEAFKITRKVYWSALNQTIDGQNKYFWDKEEARTPVQIENYMANVIAPTMTMLNEPEFIGPTGLATAYSTCRGCPFKVPCKLAMDGADYEAVLEQEFELSQHYLDEMVDEDEEEGEE